LLPDFSTLICMLITFLPSVSFFCPLLDLLSTVTVTELLALSSQLEEETDARWVQKSRESILVTICFHYHFRSSGQSHAGQSWLSPWMLWVLTMVQWTLLCSSFLPRPLVMDIWHRYLPCLFMLCSSLNSHGSLSSVTLRCPVSMEVSFQGRSLPVFTKEDNWENGQ